MDKVCSELRALNARCCRDGADEAAHALLCIYAIAISDTEAPRINSRASQTLQRPQTSQTSQTAEAEVEAESQCFVIDVGAWTRQDRVQGWREKQDGRHKTTYRIEAHCPDGVPEHNITHHSALVDRQVPVLAGGRGKLWSCKSWHLRAFFFPTRTAYGALLWYLLPAVVTIHRAAMTHIAPENSASRLRRSTGYRAQRTSDNRQRPSVG